MKNPNWLTKNPNQLEECEYLSDRCNTGTVTSVSSLFSKSFRVVPLMNNVACVVAMIKTNRIVLLDANPLSASSH